MSEPNFSINFTARMLAASQASVGQALVFDSAQGYWLPATTANRATANARSQAIALTAYGGSSVGKVSYQSSGILAAEVSGLGAGSASWVRVSSTGFLERCTPGVGDDLVGKCDADGRVHLQMGTWDSTNYAGGGGGSGAPTGAQYVTLATDAGLSAERVLTAGTGITVTDGGAGAAVTVAAPGMAASFLTLGTSSDLANERVLTAGTNISFVDGGAGSTLTINASGGGGGTPGGTNTQFQWNNASAFGGSSGLVYDSTNNQPQAPNGYVITAAGQRLILTGTPTTTRTVTFQDATHTVVGRDTTDTLTNKTYDVAGTGNVLTSTGAAQYDLLVANASGHFKRQAKGSNSTVLQTSSGGVVQWATVATAMIAPGTAGQILTTTTGPTTTWGNAAARIDLGTTPAASGLVRLGNNQGGIQFRNNGNSADHSFCEQDNTDSQYVSSNSTANLIVRPANIYLRPGASVDAMVLTTTLISVGKPIVGDSTAFAAHGRASVSGGSPTLTAAQYSRKIIVLSSTTSGTATFPHPSSEDNSYTKDIHSKTATSAVTISTGTGTTFSVSAGAKAHLAFSPDGVTLIAN